MNQLLDGPIGAIVFGVTLFLALLVTAVLVKLLLQLLFTSNCY